MRSKPTAKIILDTRVAHKENKHPLKLRVTYKRKSYYLSLLKSFTKDQYAGMFKPRKNNLQRKTYFYMLDEEKRATEILDNMKHFDWDEFKNSFLGSNDISLISEFDKKIEELKNIKTKDVYKTARSNVIKFFGATADFEDVTPKKLQQIEDQMLEQDISINTVSIYFRCIRAIFNKAIADGKIDQSLYPFGRYKYVVPNKRNVKRALTKEQILKLWNCEAKGFAEMYKAYWFFSYLGNGINIKDLILLKWEDVKGEFIVYNRQKTITTSRANLKSISIYISPEIKKILDRWGTGEDYIFPILEEGLSNLEIDRRLKNLVRQINKYMNVLAKHNGIKENVTTYVARHSYATIMRLSGVPDALISESLGHSSITTTENYFGSFDPEKIKKANGNLL